jgi:hypothetical protein
MTAAAPANTPQLYSGKKKKGKRKGVRFILRKQILFRSLQPLYFDQNCIM